MINGEPCSMDRFVVLLALILAGSATAFSQSASGRSSITGVVHDQAGAAIVGARVQLSGAGNTLQSSMTDQSGSFEFKRVPFGEYQVQINSEGFASTTVDVVVASPPRAALRIVLAIASLRQETTVASTPTQISTEASENKDTVALTEQSLSNLPVFDQDYIGAMSRFLDSGSVGTNGVSLVVNGMEVPNLGVSPSAIKEIKINQDPYSA